MDTPNFFGNSTCLDIPDCESIIVETIGETGEGRPVWRIGESTNDGIMASESGEPFGGERIPDLHSFLGLQGDEPTAW